MKSSKLHLALKVGALALAVTLSGLYSYFEFRDQPSPEEANPNTDGGEVYPMSKTPDLEMMRALPKSGPLEIPPGNFNNDPPEEDPAPAKQKQAPSFDLNEALSKTGTIKTDKLLAPEDGGAGLFGGEEQDKPTKE